jgi:mycothiol system anti-sigma-R factor
VRDCKGVLDNLFLYLDQEMEGKDALEIKAHIELCRSCFDRIEFEKVLRIHIREQTNHLCPDKLKAKIQKIIENF